MLYKNDTPCALPQKKHKKHRYATYKGDFV